MGRNANGRLHIWRSRPACHHASLKGGRHIGFALGNKALRRSIKRRHPDLKAVDRLRRTAGSLEGLYSQNRIPISALVVAEAANKNRRIHFIFAKMATACCIRLIKLNTLYPMQPDIGDYDTRCPLHLAASEARILAVSYLLGISADPSIEDRWKNTPLDEALRGGTLYHM